MQAPTWTNEIDTTPSDAKPLATVLNMTPPDKSDKEYNLYCTCKMLWGLYSLTEANDLGKTLGLKVAEISLWDCLQDDIKFHPKNWNTVQCALNWLLDYPDECAHDNPLVVSCKRCDLIARARAEL